jgi:hypothetical protein
MGDTGVLVLAGLWALLQMPSDLPRGPTPGPMPETPAGVPSAPSEAQPSWPATCPHGGDEELFACLRKFRHLEAKRCPVPFRYAAVFALTALPRMWQDSTILGQLPGLRGLVSVPTRRCPKANNYHLHPRRRPSAGGLSTLLCLSLSCSRNPRRWPDTSPSSTRRPWTTPSRRWQRSRS